MSDLTPEQTVELLVFLTVFTGGEENGYYFTTHNEIRFYSYWVLSTLGLPQEIYVLTVRTLLPTLLDLRERLSSKGILYFCPSKSSLGLSVEAYSYYKNKIQELQNL